MRIIFTFQSCVKGNFVFPISSKNIKSLLQDSYVANAGWAYLLDAKDEPLLRISSEKDEFELIPQEYLDNGQQIQEITLNGRSVEVIKSESEVMGLTYVAVLPQEYIASQITQAQKQNVQIMLFVMLLGLVCVMAITWYRGKKIDDILKMIFRLHPMEESMPNGDEMVYISHTLKNLIEHNEDLKSSILKQQPVTRGLVLERLVRGTAHGSIHDLEEYGIYLEDKKILVLSFILGEESSFDDVGVHAQETSVYKSMLLKHLDKIVKGDKYLCDTDINEGAIICVLQDIQDSQKEKIFEKLEKLCEVFWEEYDLWVRLAVSGVCENVPAISKAYEQTSEMLQYGANSENNVLFYEDYRDRKEYYYFPVMLEERLVNAIRTGNVESMHQQLKEIYQVNVMERDMKPSMMHFLVNDLQCTVFKVLHGLKEDMKIEEEEIYLQLEQLNRENDILLRFNRINKIFRFICEQVQAQSKESSDQKKDKIEEYILLNYACKDMGLTKIADDFGYASTYFSKLFKELFNENFVSYLEKVRIEKVCILLKGDDTMEKIAEQTGYNSVYVMRTAFKRIKGMTPNEFRKMNK